MSTSHDLWFTSQASHKSCDHHMIFVGITSFYKLSFHHAMSFSSVGENTYFSKNLSEMAERFYILNVHFERVAFCSSNPIYLNVHPSITLLEQQSRILQKLCQQHNKQITQIVYTLLIAVGKDLIRYNRLEIS